MNALSRAHATTGYLVFVLLFGGASAAGLNINLLLQLLGAGLVGWTLANGDRGRPQHTGLGRFLLALGLLMAVQFLPMPPGLWRMLPGREAVYQGFVTIGADAPWLTLSLNPWHSLASFAWWIPALALFISMRAPGAPTNRQVIIAIGAVAAISVVIGGLQTSTGIFYFYEITNYGQGTGFFANSNHQGSFLLCALALWGVWALGEMRAAPSIREKFDMSTSLLVGVSLLLVAGVAVSGSLACLVLLVPVLAALALVAKPDFRMPVALVILLALVIVAGFGAFLIFGPADNDLLAKGVLPGISRQEFLMNGLKILGDFAPIGSGTGSFRELYRWYEDPAQVHTVYVNHAHDDLLELLIENGVFGLLALLVFLGWYVPRSWKLWGGARRSVVQLGASLVIGLELVHSLADYPLRTAAMSSIVAIACVLMVRPVDSPRQMKRRGSRSGRSQNKGDARDMMHI